MNLNAPVKFLLVDDLEENLLALEGLLRRDNLVLLKARSANEALEMLLEDGDIALAILDVQMPETNGFQLAELMRSSSRTRHIPIMFLTAAALDEQRRFRGYEAGAVDFLNKPIEPQVLKGKADVFYDLFAQRQEVIRQRDEISRLNASLEKRVDERTAELIEANEQLQGFSYSVAHDFRQHIRGISTNASLLLEECGPQLGEHQARVVRLREVAHLMGHMTDDLLMYARMRTAEVRPVPIDLTVLATEIGQNYQTKFPQTEFVVAEGLRLDGDMTMFRIVVENLLDNAFKYSQKADAPRVEVGPEPNGFFVRDNGIGIDMAYSDKLFKPFERIATDFIGTGMGLANVKRIVERHQGRITVASIPGETTFSVVFNP